MVQFCSCIVWRRNDAGGTRLVGNLNRTSNIERRRNSILRCGSFESLVDSMKIGEGLTTADHAYVAFPSFIVVVAVVVHRKGGNEGDSNIYV
jgi:hypothetical protein